MKEISITGNGLSGICRLCLANNIRMIDMFTFLPCLGYQIIELIMKCAPVQIKKRDGKPNFICRLCYAQLEKIHRFQMQVVQSDKTLQCYLQQLHASDKQAEPNCFLQRPSNESVIHNPSDSVMEEPLLMQNSDQDFVVKRESLELLDVFETMNRKEKELENFNIGNQIYEELSLKSEQLDDNSFISTEYTENALSDFDESEIDHEYTEIDIGDTKVGFGVSETIEYLNPSKISAHHRKYDDEISNKEFLQPESKSLLTSVKFNDNEISYENEKIDKGSIVVTEGKWKDFERLHFHEFTDDINESEFSCNDSEVSCENLRVDRDSANIEKSHQPDINNKQPINSPLKRHKKSYSCDICNEHFSRQSSLNNHKHVHTGGEQYGCDVCCKHFYYIDSLKTHDCVHTSKKPYRNVCNKKIIRLHNLNGHKHLHTAKKYQCDLCRKSFSRRYDLNIHKRIHTSGKPYQCDVCKKSFSRQYDFNIHKRMHTAKKPNQCDICNKCFYRPYNLKNHKRIHTGEKPYQCDVCNKCFYRAYDLNNHKRIHTGEKPYQCIVCYKCFTQPSDLNRHKRIHTVERPYRCGYCDKSFFQLHPLNLHKRVHTGEKPYQCDLCNKCFRVSFLLKSHKLTHTGEKPYQCNFCNKCFSQSSSLNRHKSTHRHTK